MSCHVETKRRPQEWTDLERRLRDRGEILRILRKFDSQPLVTPDNWTRNGKLHPWESYAVYELPYATILRVGGRRDGSWYEVDVSVESVGCVS